MKMLDMILPIPIVYYTYYSIQESGMRCIKILGINILLTDIIYRVFVENIKLGAYLRLTAISNSSLHNIVL